MSDLIKLYIIFIQNISYYGKNQLTPSAEQMQEVQGEGKAESPTATDRPAIKQPCAEFSRQADRSSLGNDAQGTRGFLE